MQTKPKPSTSAPIRLRKPTMLREVSRNLRRRKLRSLLTLSGIALGAFTLTVMGSLAENLSISTGSLRSLLEGQVLVRPPGSDPFVSQGHVPLSVLPDIDRVEGVKVAVPRSTITFADRDPLALGPGDLVYGVDIERALESPLGELQLAAGHNLEPDDRWKIVLGSELARQLGSRGNAARPGDHVSLRGHTWEVVGVAAATGSPVDRFATASIEDVKAIQKDEEPFLRIAEIADEIMVFPDDDVDPEVLADRLRPAVAPAEVYPPSATGAQIQELAAIWNAIILGSALVALLVASLAIANTMIFSVTERNREIGTKKAIGASSTDILREFLSESAVLSFAGGFVGAGAGWLAVAALNAVSREQGVVAFTVTPRLVAFVLVTSVVVGVVAGFLPARRAARVDPVRALRTLG